MLIYFQINKLFLNVLSSFFELTRLYAHAKFVSHVIHMLSVVLYIPSGLDKTNKRWYWQQVSKINVTITIICPTSRGKRKPSSVKIMM